MASWRHIPALCILLLAGLLNGCAKQELVVYADPWLSDYAAYLEKTFEAQHPNVDMKVKEISSEVIAQHLHFGQPVDLVLCMGYDQMRADFKEKAAQRQDLADTKVLKVAHKHPGSKPKEMKTEACLMLEASQRPMRLFAEQTLKAEIESHSCHMIADFQAQARDYMLRAWVPEGLVPWHFWIQNQDLLEQRASGSLIVNAFSAVLIKNATNFEAAKQLMDLISSEESKKKLVELGHLL